MSDFPNLLASLSLDRLFESLIVALVCGILIGVFYRYSYRGASYSSKFLHSLIVLTVVTSLVILVIGNNLARAFGLVGTMSVVRFRMAIKDARDIVFVYFALAAGMAAGVGIYSIAIASTVSIGVVVVIMSKTGFGRLFKRHFLLQFKYSGDTAADPPYNSVFDMFVAKYKLVNVKVTNNEHYLDLAYTVKLKHIGQSRVFVRELGRIPGVSGVNFYNEDD